MTVTIVYGKTTDGYLHSYDPAVATARNGPADAVNGGNTGYYGMNNNASNYAMFQTFVGFDFTAVPATEVVVSAAIRAYTNVAIGSVERTAQFKGYTWSTGGLITGDWRTPAQLTAAVTRAECYNIQQSNGKLWMGGSDELVTAVQTTTSQEFVLITHRQGGTTPTSDEGMAIITADESGTALDPALIFTTTTRSGLWPVMGGAVQLAAGGWAYLTSTSTGTAVALRYAPADGSATSQIAALGLGTAATQFSPSEGKGAQGLALVVDKADNLYVVGRQGSAENSVGVQAYVKGAGFTWTAKAMLAAALPAYSGAINQVAAAWHDVAGGTLMVLAGHAPGIGSGYEMGDLSYAICNSAVALAGAGTLLRASGKAAGSFVPGSIKSGWFATYTNEVGTALDVQAAGGANPRWGYVASLDKGMVPGENAAIGIGRYILNATATGLDHASVEDNLSWAVKDASAKVRVVRISDTVAALVTADADPGWGITVTVVQFQGTDAGAVELGSCNLDGEGILNLPTASAMSTSLAWDAVYNSVENRLWVYYVDSTDAKVLRRTSVNLNTYQPDRNSILAHTAAVGATIEAVRAPRNATVTDRSFHTLALNIAGTRSNVNNVDQFNLAPTEPLLTPRANYDATTAATFAWTFKDPNPGDTQSAYQLQVVDVALGTTALDTGKVASTTSSRNVAGGTLTNGKDYQWRVMTWDALDVASPWSAYGSFRASAGGSVTITDPAVDNELTLITDERQITWSVTDTVQASYRVILFKVLPGGSLGTVSDTGWVVGTATSVLVSGMASDTDHEVWVQVRNASNVTSDYGKRKLRPSYATPELPLVVATPHPDEGYVEVVVENPLPGQPVNSAPEWLFEPGTDMVSGWFLASCTWATSTDQAHQGTQSGKLTVTGTPVQAYVRPQSLPVVPGQRYTCRFWAWSAVARTITASIDWLAAGGGAYMSTNAYGQAVPAGAWTLCTVTATAPAGAGAASYGPTLSGNPATGSVIYVDELALPQASDRPDVLRNLILRRVAGESSWIKAGETGLDGTFRDYGAPAGVVLEYKVRGETA